MTDASSSSTILIADDDRGVLRLVQKTLERAGYDTATVVSGGAAMAWLSVNAADLLLVDLKLPDINGGELVRKVAETGRVLPFVVITGEGDERTAVEMMKRGALDYVVKGAQFVDLLPAVVGRAIQQVEKDRRLAVAERQARLTQTAVDQGYNPVMIISDDQPDPKIQYLNRAFTALIGCAEDELIGGLVGSLEKFTGPWKELGQALASGEPFIGETQLRSVKGESHIADCTITPVRDEAGKQSHWAVILRDITHRRRLEREVLEISEREQNRIGHELHDGLGQQLTAIEMMCHTLSEGLADSGIAVRRTRLKKQAQQIGGLLREAITFTRSLSHGLSPVRMRIDGLEAALKGLALQTDQAGRVRCRFDCPVEVRVLDDHVAGHLYRIAQEALNNALKHGQPKEVVIRLARDKGSLRLQVKDDGAGLPQKRNPSQGMGLQVMQYRAHAIGAALSVESAPGKGVTVTCILPTEEHAP